MPSTAYSKLLTRLAEVDEILTARDAICPANAGKPALRRGAAVLRAGTVLLSAVFEGFVEDLFDTGVELVYSAVPSADRNALRRETSEKLNNASPFKINLLYFNLGIPWIMSDAAVCWQKFNNASVSAMLQGLIKARNQIAHGEERDVRRTELEAWRKQIELLAGRLDEVVRLRIQAVTGSSPW